MVKILFLSYLNNNPSCLFPLFIPPVLFCQRKEGFCMSVLFKRVHDLDKRLEAQADRFSFRHPVLAFFAYFIGLPVCILAAVFFFTVVITVPVALIFGWL